MVQDALLCLWPSLPVRRRSSARTGQAACTWLQRLCPAGVLLAGFTERFGSPWCAEPRHESVAREERDLQLAKVAEHSFALVVVGESVRFVEAPRVMVILVHVDLDFAGTAALRFAHQV